MSALFGAGVEWLRGTDQIMAGMDTGFDASATTAGGFASRGNTTEERSSALARRSQSIPTPSAAIFQSAGPDPVPLQRDIGDRFLRLLESLSSSNKAVLIELDGSHHPARRRRGRPDEEQSPDPAGSRAEGYRVLRFWNAELNDNLDGVLDTIYAALYGSLHSEALTANPPHPGALGAPTLPLEGRVGVGAIPMPDLLLELFSEEIPARMQRRAAEDLKKLVTDALVERGFLYEGARAFATPRRLALHVAGLPAKGEDVREESKGPRVGAPEAAIQGFLKSAGLASLDEATIDDPKKGEFYLASSSAPAGRRRTCCRDPARHHHSFPGRNPCAGARHPPSPARCAGCARCIDRLHLRAGDRGARDRALRRRRHRGRATSPTATASWRRAPIRVRRFDDYVAALERAKVVLDADRRKDMILPTPRTSPSRRGSNWSRTKAC